MTVYYRFAVSTFLVKIVIRLSAFVLEYLLQLPIRLAFAAIFTKMGVLQIGTRAMVIENKEISPKDTETSVSPSSSVGSSSPISNCVEENKVTFATGTLTDDALSWWNAYAQPIGIEQANKINWTELKRLLTNKYCPRTEIKKMEDEFYDLTVKGNDLKTYDIC
nr:reverse transcriptase domain-containing protein [Tanacetum cinerariifolium]